MRLPEEMVDLPLEVQAIVYAAAEKLRRDPDLIFRSLKLAFSPPEIIIGKKEIARYLGWTYINLAKRLERGDRALEAIIGRDIAGRFVAREDNLRCYMDARQDGRGKWKRK